MADVEPLCLCGARGCPLAAEHEMAFVVLPKRRRHRGGGKRPRHGRR